MKHVQEQYKVTDSQLDAATRFVNCTTREVLYVVQSATSADVQYQVRWNRQYRRFACQCKASHNGMNCWHVRSAVASEVLYRENVRALQSAQALFHSSLVNRGSSSLPHLHTTRKDSTHERYAHPLRCPGD